MSENNSSGGSDFLKGLNMSMGVIVGLVIVFIVAPCLLCSFGVAVMKVFGRDVEAAPAVQELNEEDQRELEEYEDRLDNTD